MEKSSGAALVISSLVIGLTTASILPKFLALIGSVIVGKGASFSLTNCLVFIGLIVIGLLSIRVKKILARGEKWSEPIYPPLNDTCYEGEPRSKSRA